MEPERQTEIAPQATSLQVETTQTMVYSAPLPPAAEFARYESVLAGSADRILKMAEHQSEHRRFIEKIVVIFDSVKSVGGLVSALVIVLTSIGYGVNLIMNDKPTSGFVAMFVPLGTVAAAFIITKKKEDKNSDHNM